MPWNRLLSAPEMAQKAIDDCTHSTENFACKECIDKMVSFVIGKMFEMFEG